MYNLRLLQLHTPDVLSAELEKIGTPAALLRDGVAQGTCRAVKLERVPLRLARFLFQELSLEGGTVALPPRLASRDRAASECDVLLLGTRYQLQHLAVRIRTQSDGELNLLADDLERALDLFDLPLRGAVKIGSANFQWGARTYVMGIVNVTPDSFSGDGIIAQSKDFVDQAVALAEQMVADGADILDIGGESTRPGSQPIAVDEERQRVIPVIERLRAKVTAPISIDTYKAEIARAALDAGADLVNDVWGLQMDQEMKRVVAQRGVPVAIMHNRSKPKDAVQTERLGGRYVGVEYGDLMADVVRELRAQVELALDAGIAADKIIIDPGIGFGKTTEQNLELLDRLGELRVLGFPILLGASRKGFIGFTLDLPVDQRVEGTAVAVALGIERGADIVRVHDVKQMARVARMTDAVVRNRTAPPKS
ncbi:MAG: dihydropteroate synthase [Chloroflexota bacterium]|nr:dihydropteroate synthase [Chloroflexota bacterium]